MNTNGLSQIISNGLAGPGGSPEALRVATKRSFDIKRESPMASPSLGKNQAMSGVSSARNSANNSPLLWMFSLRYKLRI